MSRPRLAISWSFAIFICPALATAAPPDVRAAQSLDALLEPVRAAHGVPALAGAVVTAEGAAVVGAVGVRKMGDPARVKAGDKFHLGSCTKAMTASMIVRLVERKTLRWNTTVAEGLPELAARADAAYGDVTLEELLAHRGGFPPSERSWPEGMSARDLRALPGSPRDQRREYVARMLAQPPAGPRGKYIYSNAGYVVAAAIAERAADTPFETLLEREVFVPLEMTSSGFGPPGSPDQVDQPWPHVVMRGKSVPLPPGPASDNPLVLNPAGRVHAPLADWARFVAAHLEGTKGKGDYLSAASFRHLHAPPAGGDYALGWIVVERPGIGRVLAHEGSNTLNHAHCRLVIDEGVAVLAATNQGGPKAGRACGEAVERLLEWHAERSAR